MDFRKSRVLNTSGTRPRLPRSDPQLPRPLWEGFKREFPKSIIFTPFWSDIRHHMLIEGPTAELTSAIPVHLHSILQAAHSLGSSVSTDVGQLEGSRGSSWLHLAAMQGDLPLAHEALRLGTSVHSKDVQGHSPLFRGLKMLTCLMRNGESTIPAGFISPADTEEQLRRLRSVCLFFISHHSDPNETYGENVSVLALACIVGSWDLIRALLLHGANPRGLARLFPDQAAKSQFENLVRELSTALRPPRICPCASGRPLIYCHITSQPYFPSHICPCKSRKIYSACCAKKCDLTFHEIWNPEKEWLDTESKLSRTYQGATHPGVAVTELHLGLGMLAMGVPGFDGHPLAENSHWLDQPNPLVLQVLAKDHKIDPAYVAACKQTMATISPTAVRAVPRPMWIGIVKKWNDAVDAYIASGVDNRDSGIIESAAKIGSAGGPLYRKCEAAGCANIESSDSASAFPQCSGCKTTVYCSHSCQKSAWKVHKSACRAGKVEAQMLPSQEAYAVELARVTGFKVTQPDAYAKEWLQKHAARKGREE